MFFKRRKMQTPKLTYFTNFWKQPSRRVLLKRDPEKIRKIRKIFVEFFFSPEKLLA